MKKLKSMNCVVIVFVLSICSLLIGCSVAINDTKVNISFSEFTGTKQKEFNLNSNDNSLNMSGNISISSGTVDLYVKVKETEEVLYSHTVNKSDSGDINIDILDLKENKNLLFILEAKSAKNFKINLTSQQKLVLDKETPTRPEK